MSGDLNVTLEGFDNAEVLQLQQTYRRDLDLSVLLAFGIYALNIVDAVVFAHLYDFDVSDDLTLRVKPALQHAHFGKSQNINSTNPFSNATPSLQLGLTYRF